MATDKQVDTTGLLGWIDQRFPLTSTIRAHLTEYYAPKNFNFWYFFGSLALLVLVIQIVTGIFLVMHYKPDATKAFQSIEYIMRDVPWGWLVRYMHSTGASMFFVVVYLHMVRGLMYGSYRKPRELVWIFGVAIFLCLMAEAFFGYLLPWGQMSYWGAQVIVNLFAAIPLIGPDLAIWIRGDYVVSDATLNRFFSFHVIAIPLVLVGLVVAHIVALHEVGSNNPDGIEIKDTKGANGKPLDGIPFHPYYTVHDIMGVGVFLMVFFAIVFFAPEMGGYFLEYNNFIPADPLKTPAHIAPVWYFTPFYSMLRATTDVLVNVLVLIMAAAGAGLLLKGRGKARWVGPVALLVGAVLLKTFDAKLWGVVVMGGAVLILFFLPWLDHCAVKSIRYRPSWHKALYALFGVVFVVLGYLGIKPPSDIGTLVAQIGTLFYFGFFLLMPWWSTKGQCKPVPKRITFTPHCNLLVLALLGAVCVVGLGAAKPAYAAGGAVQLDKAPDLTNDMAALQSGAKLFVNHCLNCHGAESMRFNRLRDIGLTDEQIKNNLLFTTDKVGDPMVVAFDAKEAKQWLGAAPPDLSVIARSRASAAGSGADYLYTYLRSYHRDPTKATGWNNHVFPNVGMPHVLWQQQEQLKPAEFDRAMAELTSFLVYMGEPARQDRVRLGVMVLLFLGLFTVCAWRLNAAYWKDIH